MLGIGPTGMDTVWDLYLRTTIQEAALSSLDDGGVLTESSSRDVARAATSAALHLTGEGVRRGDRVAIVAGNSTGYVQCLGAMARLGAIAVPLNVLLAPPELAFQIADTEPKAVIADAALTPKVDEAVKHASWDGTRLTLGPERLPWVALDLAGADVEDTAVRIDPMAPFEIFYTSGTTDRPKGVLQSHRSILEEAQRMAGQWALRADDVLFGHVPLFHVSGQHCLLFPAMTSGASVVLGRQFSASRWSDEMRRANATVVMLVGPQIRMIMEQPESDSDAGNRLRAAPYGLAVPRDMEQAFERRFGAPLFALSGCTEAIAVSFIEPFHGQHRWPSLGRPLSGKQVAILDDQGQAVPAGESGEICVGGEPGVSLMLGYWNRPEATQQTLVDGWLHTGDIGRMDADGFFYFVDRKKDIIKRSGENVSASEVERVICEMPGVAEAAVVGRPDPVRDEAVVAFIIVGTPAPSVDEIKCHCEKNLARFKVPEEFRVVEDLPRTSLGKVEKKLLRELAIRPSPGPAF